jgi:hypothetical protein
MEATSPAQYRSALAGHMLVNEALEFIPTVRPRQVNAFCTRTPELMLRRKRPAKCNFLFFRCTNVAEDKQKTVNFPVLVLELVYQNFARKRHGSTFFP